MSDDAVPSGDSASSADPSKPKPSQGAGCGTYLALIIALTVVACLMLACNAMVNRPKESAVTSGPVVPDSASSIQKCRVAVRANLKDPDSAQFSDETAGEKLVTGTVRARNSYGGMTVNNYSCDRYGTLISLQKVA